MRECTFFFSTLEFLVNRLRGKTIPVKLIRELGKAVCVCSAVDVSRDEEFERELSDVRKWLDAVENQVKDQYSDWYSDEVIQVLKRVCNEAGDVDKGIEDTMAKIKMLTVLRKLENGDVSCIPSVQNMGKQANITYEEQFELDLKPSYAGLLVGSKGKHLKALSHKYSANVRILTEQFSPSSTVVVKVTTQNADSLKPLVDELHLKAKKITAARAKHEQTVHEWYTKLAKYRQLRLQLLDVTAIEPEEFKEDARAKFEKKHRSSTAKAKQTPILENGHCMQCMLPFYKGKNEEGSCQFHSGFPKNGQWSCCEVECDDQDTHKMHTTTGCTYGRHLWRPGIRAKVKQNGRKKGAGQKSSQLGCLDFDWI